MVVGFVRRCSRTMEWWCCDHFRASAVCRFCHVGVDGVWLVYFSWAQPVGRSVLPPHLRQIRPPREWVDSMIPTLPPPTLSCLPSDRWRPRHVFVWTRSFQAPPGGVFLVDFPPCCPVLSSLLARPPQNVGGVRELSEPRVLRPLLRSRGRPVDFAGCRQCGVADLVRDVGAGERIKNYMF